MNSWLGSVSGGIPARIDGAVCRVVHQGEVFRFFVAAPADLIQSHHASGCLYEIEELGIIRQYVRDYSSILDVGANVGNHCVFFDRVLRARQVVVFEPNPEAYELLKVNLLLNQAHSVQTGFLGIGLADEAGAAAVHLPWANNLGAAELVRQPQGQIPLSRGDDLLADREFDFIKVDVEGMELEVLRGLRRTILKSRPVMFVEVRNDNKPLLDAYLLEIGYGIATSFRRYEALENYLLLPN